MPRKHGAWARNHKLFDVWHAMIARCEDPRARAYAYYGGRGICVAAEWHDPHAFIDWALAHGWEPGLDLDRIDNDGPYSPANCRFISHRANLLNQRRNRYLELLGQRKTVMEWSHITGISHGTLYGWVSKYGERETERRIYRRLGEVSA